MEAPIADSIEVGLKPYEAVGLVTLVQVAVAMGNFALPALAPFLQVDFKLSLAQVGAFESALFLGALLMSLPGGWWVDRLGARRLLAAALIMEGSFLIVASLAPSFPLILVCSFVAGMGQGMASPALTKAVANWAPDGSRATAMGIKQTGVTIGASLVAAILPTLALVSSWRAALAPVGLVMVAAASLAIVFYRDPIKAGEPKMVPLSSKPIWYQVLTDRNIFLTTIAAVLLTVVQFCFVGYVILFLNQRLDWTIASAGICLASAQIGGIGGRIGWGVLSDRVFQGRGRPVFAMVAIVSAVTSALLALASPQFSMMVIFLVALIFGVSALGWGGIQLTMVTELAGIERAGITVGLSVGLTYVGIIAGPPLFGYLVDATNSYSQAWFAVALVALLALAPLAFVHEKSISTERLAWTR